MGYIILSELLDEVHALLILSSITIRKGGQVVGP